MAENSVINKKRNLLRRLWLIPVLVILFLINYVASIYHSRIDLTREKRFTISAPVKKLLKELKEPVTVDVFLKGEFPSGFKKLAGATTDLLAEFKEIAGSKLEYRFISPADEMPGTGKPYADTLQGLGAQPINLKVQLKAGEQSQFVYPVALVHSGDKLQIVDLYAGTRMMMSASEFDRELNSAEAAMEYSFAHAFEKITSAGKPLVGYTIGNGQLVDMRSYDLGENILKTDYDLKTINPASVPFISDTFKLLIVVKPTIPFSEAQKMRLDQYVMHGGKILWLIDRLEAEMDSLQIKNQVIAYDRNLNLEDLLFKYGVRINPDLLMDLQSDLLPLGVNGQQQYEFLHWNYFPLFESLSNHIINKNLGLVAGRFVNTIDTVNAENIRKTILLASSDNSRSISAPAMITPDENRNAPEDAAFKQKKLIAGVLLEGNFKSLYANRMPAAMLDSFTLYGQPFQSTAVTGSKMIVISDGDIALNTVSQGEPLQMGMNLYTAGSQYEYPFANHEFIRNCIEYLVNSSGLIEAKAKDFVLRVLDKKKVEEQRFKWQLINIVVPVLVVISFGLFFQWWRRKNNE